MLKVIKFSAEWCGPCKMFAPIYDKVKTDFESTEIEFQKVDVDKDGEMAIQFNIMSVPTVVFIKDGKEAHRFSGAYDEAELVDIIKTLTKEDK